MAMDVEAGIRDLKRRVGELEGSFGFLTTQIKGVHKDLLAFQEQTEQRFEKVETDIRDLREEVGSVRNEVGSVRNEVRSVRQDVQTLRKDMPGIVAEALRETLGERRRNASPNEPMIKPRGGA
jgi:archaellum component FlaC